MNNQDICDVLTTAAESGWSWFFYDLRPSGWGQTALRRTDPSYSYNRFPVSVHEVDDYGRTIEKHELTVVKLRAGIERAAKHWGQSVAAFIENHDADSADVAIQFALLGEVRYA